MLIIAVGLFVFLTSIYRMVGVSVADDMHLIPSGFMDRSRFPFVNVDTGLDLLHGFYILLFNDRDVSQMNREHGLQFWI